MTVGLELQAEQLGSWSEGVRPSMGETLPQKGAQHSIRRELGTKETLSF